MLLEGDWAKDGYLVARQLFTAERVERLRAVAEGCHSQWRNASAESGEPGELAGGEECMRHLNHPGYFAPGTPGFAELMEAIADPRCLELVETHCLGAPALFRSTSLFVNPRTASREGPWHRDSQFLIPSEDLERGFLEQQSANGLINAMGLQMQIALLPSDDIELVKGSHARWDTPDEYAVRHADGGAHATDPMPGAVRISLQPGDAVLFNFNGFHRGRYHVDRPRQTLMFTYTGRDFPLFDYFGNQPWFLRADYLDGLSAGAREFFGRFVDAFGEQMKVHLDADGTETRFDQVQHDLGGGYATFAEQTMAHLEVLGVEAGALAALARL